MARPTSAVRPDARPDLYTRVTNAIVADLDRTDLDDGVDGPCDCRCEFGGG